MIWTREPSVLWKGVTLRDLAPASLPVRTEAGVNALTRLVLLLMAGYTALSFLWGEHVNKTVYVVGVCVILSSLMISTQKQWVGALVNDTFRADAPAALTPPQSSLAQSAQNLYGNPLLYENWPSREYTGPIAPLPDDRLARMSYGTERQNPGHTFYTLPDTTNLSRTPIVTAAYGTYHSQAEHGVARGGMWY